MTERKHKEKVSVKRLYFITHVDNIPSIIERGIYSHGEMEKQGIAHTPIYDTQIVGNRPKRITPSGDSLWEYANLYFNARNPMMYRVMLEKKPSEIGVIGVDSAVM